MKHAVILAHPRAASFSASIARTCVETLEGLGHDCLLRDLYAMDFDPRLMADELPGPGDFKARPDVLAERALLADVDSYIFVYPFWFNAPPAILKGYVDRVMGMHFGYAPGARPLLTGRSLMSFSTSGAPDQWVRSTGALEALKTVFDLHLGGVCGLAVRDHRHYGGIHSMLAEDAAADLLADVRDSLGRAFAAA